ncbi:MAG: rRNA methyltransferase [Bacteroidota bacterium]
MEDAFQLPIAFARRMQDQLGQAAFSKFEDALIQKPITSVRLNPQKLSRVPFRGATPIPWHPKGYFLEKRPEFVFDPLFHAGAYYVQEASSMLVNQFFPKAEPMRILDLCAAPGGKSTLISQVMPPGSLLISNEVIRSRAMVLAENVTRWGDPQVLVTQSDPKAFASLGPVFDLILVDAPCSGEGLFRKDPASRNQWSTEEVQTCAARQKRILADVLPSLKHGGWLIYSTCTYAEAENEAIIRWLIESFPLRPDPVAGLEEFSATASEIAGEKHAGWRCMPHLFKGEGFFISRLRKVGSTNLDKEEPTFKKHKKKSYKPKITPAAQAFLSSYVKESYWEHCSIRGDYLVYRPHYKEWEGLPEGLKMVKGEMLLGKVRPKGLTPFHDLALSSLLVENTSKLELDLNEALSFLRKQTIKAHVAESGWKLATYEGAALGWIKIAGGKIKNHYPMNWRIRKH